MQTDPIFRHALVEQFVGGKIGKFDGVEITGAQTSSAAHAVFSVYPHLTGFSVKGEAFIGAFLEACHTAPAFFLVVSGLPLLCCSVFPAREPQPMPIFLIAPPNPVISWPLKWVRLMNTSASRMARPILAACTYSAADHRHLDVIGTFQSVTNQDRTTYSQRGEPVFPGALQMFQGVFAAARIHGVAVGEKRLATEFLDQVDNRTGIIGAEIADIDQFSEMEFDGDELAFHVQLIDPRLADELLQLGGGSPSSKALVLKSVKYTFAVSNVCLPWL